MLFADRTSTSWLRSNQIRLYFSTVAYLLMQALRRLGLAGTELAQAQCHTVRLKLLKIGAQIRITVRKIWVSLSTGYPYLDYSARCTGSCKWQLCAAEREGVARPIGRHTKSLGVVCVALTKNRNFSGRGRRASPPEKVRTTISGS